MNVVQANVAITPMPAPARARLLLAALSYVVLLGISLLAFTAPLPFDRQFLAVVYLMNPDGQRYMPYLFSFSSLALAAAFLLILIAALVSPRRLSGNGLRVVSVFYRYAIALPLFAFLVNNLSRYVANLIYYFAEAVRWDLTPLLGRLETPLIEGVQRALYSPLMSEICSILYSAVWVVSLLTIGVAFIILNQPRAMTHAIVGYFLVSILAIPFFILLPVFDPWTTNPIYGNTGAWQSHIGYLYANPHLPTLQFINRHLKWATGSCLPSLHIAVPLMLYFITRRSNLPFLSIFFGVLFLLTGFAIVYLGRHWLIDIVVAVPYTYFIVRLAERLNFNLILD